MAKATCTACRKPIKATEAALTINTPTTSERWHIRCLRPADDVSVNFTSAKRTLALE